MLPFLQEQYGNASSQYSLGVKAKRAIAQARCQAAAAIGAESSEITFTSGGSEANSWVLRGAADFFHTLRNTLKRPLRKLPSGLNEHLAPGGLNTSNKAV
jgi:cysteine sulfinate desulfinase/cysteine desulfurase-like protein